MDSKGIELAASFIVVLIASIIIFGLALGITYKIFCASNAKIQQLDAQTEQLVEQKLDSGAQVAIPIASKTATQSASFCGSSSVAAASFGLGIRNDLTDPKRFTIDCTYKGLETSDGGIQAPPGFPSGEPCSELGGSVVKYDSAYLSSGLGKEIPPKTKQASLVVITAPSSFDKGTHMFTIQVCQVTDGTVCDASAKYGAMPDPPGGFNGFYGAANIYLTLK